MGTPPYTAQSSATSSILQPQDPPNTTSQFCFLQTQTRTCCLSNSGTSCSIQSKIWTALTASLSLLVNLLLVERVIHLFRLLFEDTLSCQSFLTYSRQAVVLLSPLWTLSCCTSSSLSSSQSALTDLSDSTVELRVWFNLFSHRFLGFLLCFRYLWELIYWALWSWAYQTLRTST